jgi:tellurite resistance protein TehA-like permease
LTDWNPRTNGTLRGFLIVVAVAAILTAAGRAGDVGLDLVFLILRIAFIVAIAIFLFGLWRRNREQISLWPFRSRAVFYGAAALAIVDLGASALLASYPRGGLEALVFFFVLAASGFAMWRVWRDEHTYGY